MGCKQVASLWGALAVSLSLLANSSAEPPGSKPATGELSELVGVQQLVKLPVRVVDGEGQPVAKAKVAPWALQCSQGHGWWRKGDEEAGVDPQDAFTDEAGVATVLYPYFRDRTERIRTVSVSLKVDHPDFAYLSDLHIDVPLESTDPQVIKLAAGVPCEVHPTLNGKSANLDNLFALWSDGRSWQPGSAPQKSPDGALRIPAMPPGDNSVLLVVLDGDRATHFSAITDFKLASGEPKKIDVALRPALRVRGVLSDNVPRPVRAGRVKAWTLNPANASNNRAEWWTWAPIHADGTFTIDGWPADEPLQLIAICDGFMATSGSAPDCVKNPPDPKEDRFNRPQVFRPAEDKQIELAMTPLVKCVVTTVDEDEKPVAAVSVESWPNVGWWNSVSQIYCYPLARGERMLRQRDYQAILDGAFPSPFQAKTDAQGKTTLAIPAGDELLVVSSAVYELPVFLGRRDVRVKLARGETTEAVLRLQPIGTDKLGEWDKLAGVVFGCSTREGRRICALPGVRLQMDEFAKRFREGKNQRDPKLLAEAYTAVADAFTGVGDVKEAGKWRQKAAEQAKLVAETTGKKAAAE